MNVSKVIPSTRNRLAGATFQIDQLVEDQLREKDQRPNEMASDEIFFVGFTWTLQEESHSPGGEEFLDSANEDKRENLIDQLLENSRLCQQHVQLLGGHT